MEEREEPLRIRQTSSCTMRRVTTLKDNGSETQAFAVRGERFVAVGGEAEVMCLGGHPTRLIDVGGRRVILE
jgi:predicted amidohydrolase YtcJ